MKSQFSIYDAFGDEDKHEVSMSHIAGLRHLDVNIFKVVCTHAFNLPTSESIRIDYKHTSDVKYIRIKSAQSWLDYVCLTPNEPEWHKK